MAQVQSLIQETEISQAMQHGPKKKKNSVCYIGPSVLVDLKSQGHGAVDSSRPKAEVWAQVHCQTLPHTVVFLGSHSSSRVFPHSRKREEIPAMILEACHVMPEQHL